MEEGKIQNGERTGAREGATKEMDRLCIEGYEQVWPSIRGC